LNLLTEGLRSAADKQASSNGHEPTVASAIHQTISPRLEEKAAGRGQGRRQGIRGDCLAMFITISEFCLAASVKTGIPGRELDGRQSVNQVIIGIIASGVFTGMAEVQIAGRVEAGPKIAGIAAVFPARAPFAVENAMGAAAPWASLVVLNVAPRRLGKPFVRRFVATSHETAPGGGANFGLLEAFQL
jgi:hypothetical protein